MPKPPPTTHYCRFCAKTYAHSSSLNEHVRFEHNMQNLIFTCDICAQHFTNKQKMRKHIMRRHARKSQCHLCGKTINSESYNSHMRHAHGEATVLCTQCPQLFKTEARMRAHVRAVHPTTAAAAAADDGRVYACDQCDKCFTDEMKLSRHKRLHDKLQQELQVPCPTCKKVLKNRLQLEKHLKKTNCANALADLIHVPCIECSESLNAITATKHMQHVHPDAVMQFQCTKCPLKQAKAGALFKHMRRTHTEKNRFVCPVCAKPFVRDETLQRHMVLHTTTSERKFECTVCQNNFTKRKGLLRHMRIHEGVRYQCQQCDKSFSQSYGLQKHVQSVHK